MEGVIPIRQEDFDLAIKATTSFYQSKRAQLKKKVTHWIGKFMIVKAENNQLRTKISKLARENERLMEAIIKAEIKEYVKIVGRGSGFMPFPGVTESKNTVHKKEPMAC